MRLVLAGLSAMRELAARLVAVMPIVADFLVHVMRAIRGTVLMVFVVHVREILPVAALDYALSAASTSHASIRFAPIVAALGPYLAVE